MQSTTTVYHLLGTRRFSTAAPPRRKPASLGALRHSPFRVDGQYDLPPHVLVEGELVRFFAAGQRENSGDDRVQLPVIRPPGQLLELLSVRLDGEEDPAPGRSSAFRSKAP